MLPQMASEQRKAASAEVPAPDFTQLTWEGGSLHQPGAGAAQAASGVAASGEGPRPRVLIVGGSMGGCCAALALGALGCPVSIFERMPGELKTQGAGLVIQPDMAAFLQQHGVVDDVEELCVKSAGRQYVDAAGAVVSGNSDPQLFTAWDVCHRAIKARVPPAAYHGGCAVTEVSAGPQGVSLTLEGGRQHSGELLVGCDGPGSLVRRTLLPDVRSEYQGYVAWRGLVPESELPPHIPRFLQNKFTVHQMPHSHILAYTIPGADGGTQPGSRRVNWVWYVNTPAAALPELFRDARGERHLFSVPRGMLRPEVAAERKAAARRELPGPLADMVEHTPDVFVQAIHDLLSPRLKLADNACLLGDAGCILRPHTAAGTTKAAVNSLALASMLQAHSFNLPAALEAYESSQLALARYLVDVGRRIGTRSQLSESEGAAEGGAEG